MNTKNFRFHMPVAVHYGVGIAHNMTGRIRGERVMIVCDPFLYQSGVAEKLGGVTCMIVAQRIGTIRNADKIVVLDEGKAVGIGTHEELIKNCAVYREIAMSQLSAEELGA